MIFDVCLYVCNVCIHVCMYVCTYVCTNMYIYIHTYIHTRLCSSPETLSARQSLQIDVHDLLTSSGELDTPLIHTYIHTYIHTNVHVTYIHIYHHDGAPSLSDSQVCLYDSHLAAPM